MADEKKTPQEEIAELQKQIVTLTERATTAEATAEKLTKDNETLRQTNQELFIRATRVASGMTPQEAEKGEKADYSNISEIGKNYFANNRKKK